MASNQQNITGLLLAKREQVKALQDLGFADITESSRASLFAERIRWAAGLLDIRVAADRKRDGKKFISPLRSGRLSTMPDALRSLHYVVCALGLMGCRL